MLDTIDQVLRAIGSLTEPLRNLDEDVRDPVVVVIVLVIAGLTALGAQKN